MAMTWPADLPKPSDMADFAADTYDPNFYDYGHQHWITGDVHVIGRRIGRFLCIAIRGTTRDGQDILRDIRFALLWISIVGFGPAGFLRGVRRLIEETDFLADVGKDLEAGTLIVVGHSLGGAMALVLGAWLTEQGNRLAAVYAFEPARCGGFKMRRIWRLIPNLFVSWDGDDIVPRVPFLYLLPKNITKIGRVLPHPSFLRLLVALLHLGQTVAECLHCHKISVVAADLRAAGL